MSISYSSDEREEAISSPLVLLLPHVEPVEVAVRSMEGLLKLRNLGLTRQSEPAAGHLLLWRGLFLDISLRWARSPRSSEWLSSLTKISDLSK